ncbi:hypothetical protein SASPL_126054 [Salvia splendens]|uniref:Uncharacterized protein n=1 Tax=Salvia splendens TaxID=180675 RepID=A0A8X8XJR6_SALSN|nr:hypothetical protein SASPL_126054 [Salvia splendens]
MADTDPHTFVPLPQVEGQGSVRLESHDGEWIVQRSTSATDEHADSHESHEKEGEPIGELFLSCNITDHHPLEVVLTPRQKTEELELSIPLPHNCNLEKVNDIDSEPCVLSSYLESKDYIRVENSRKESVEFGAQNQGILILPPTRENAQLKELVDYFSEVFDTDSSRHGMDSIGGVVEQLSGVVEEESMILRKDAIGNFEEFGNYSKFSLQFCLDAKAGGGKIDHGQEVELRDLISTLTQELGEEIQFVDDASRFLSDKITGAIVKVPAYLNDSQRISTEDVSSLSYGFEIKTFTPKDVQEPEQDGKDNRDIFILEIGILVGKKHGGKREEDPLHGDMSFDRCLCIDEAQALVDLVRIRFWTKTGPWLESSLIRQGSSLGGSVDTITIAWLIGEMKLTEWIRERSVVRLLEASVRSNGQIISASKAAGEREQVLCLKRLLVVQEKEDATESDDFS